MNTFYKKLFPLFLLTLLACISNNSYAQKNLKLVITKIEASNSSGTDCDAACLGGDNEIDWVFDIDDGGTDVDEDCYNLSDDNNSNSTTPNFSVFNRNYDFACQWPSGNIDFNVEGWDEDCADACIGGGFGNTVSDLACTVNVNKPYPSSTNGTYTYTATCNYDKNFDGTPNCGGTITVTYQWVVSGSWKAQTGFNYICGAADFGTLALGGTKTNGAFSNSGANTEDICFSNEPNVTTDDETVWFKFTSSATPGSNINVDVTASGALCAGWVKVYEGPSSLSCPLDYSTNPFSVLTQVGSAGVDLSDVDINCPKASQAYYVQVEMCTPGLQAGCIGTCDAGTLGIVIKDNGAPRAADICSQAIDLGTLSIGGTIGDAAGNNKWNNFCAGTTGDPNPNWTLLGVSTDPYQTVWFKFNTGASGAGRNISIDGYNDPHSWGDQIDLKLALYSGTCGSMTLIDKDYDTPPYSETLDVTCLQPNTEYYILVGGSNIEPITGSSKEGYFGLTVKDNGPYPVNDLICDAKNITVQTKYTYNSYSLNSESNVSGTNCWEPNPNWTAEVCQDNDAAVWYKIGQVPGRTIVVDANDNGSDDISIQMALYSSTTNDCNATKTLVQTENNISSNDEDAYFNCLNPNLYYWLMVDGGDYDPTCLGIAKALEEGDFSLRFWFPEEGEITGCAAEYLGAVPDGGSITIKNLSNICGAGSITNFPAPSSFSFDKAVVYSFTTPPAVGYTDASVKIEGFTNPYYSYSSGGNMDPTFLLAGDEIDMQLALYSDGACSASHFVVGSNYDVTVGTNVRTGSDESLIVNCLKPNTVYYLVVDGSPLNSNGYYDLKISDYGKHTPNDLLCQAIDLTATNSAPWTNCNSNTVVQLNNQNNYCATTTNDIPASLGIRPPNWGEINSPVWYKFKAPKSGKLKIEANNSISDVVPPFDEPEISAQLAVFFLPGGYRGTCADLSTEKDRLQYIGSNHDALLHDEEYTIECLMPDSIYYLLVDGSSETLCPTCTRGEFYLKLTADPRDRPATNDLPCDAIDLGTPAVWTTPAIYDTRVSPASGAGTYPSPTTGYPTTTGLHNGPRNNAGSCMRVENNFCAGIDNEPAVNGGNFFTDFSPDGTVWYKFTAPSTGEVKINTISDPDSRGDLLYTQIGVFETSDNTCTGTMVGIAADGLPDNLDGDNELTVKCLDPGKTYFLMVDGAGVNKRGYFELQIQAVPATLTGPANDDICDATAVTYPASIGSTTSVDDQTNRCATIQTIYPSPTTFTTDADVWYKFTTPNTAAPHAVKVEVTSGLPWPFGDAMDPQIALYKMNPTSGPCATSFTLVDDDYSALGLPFYESFEFHCLEQNTTYYLMVDGSGLNEQGNFDLDITRIAPHPLPTNDNICSVGTSTTNGYLGTLGATTGNKIGNTTTNWHNFCSSVETGESALMTDGNYSLDQTVWFHFKTPNVANNIDVEIRAESDPNNVGDAVDLQMLLVQGNPGCSPTDFTTLTPIESVDPLLTFDATMNVCLPPNTDFYIQVDGSGLNKQGYFTMEVENMGTTSSPVNDKICNAKTLPSSGTITGSYSGYTNDNNICATLEANEKQEFPGGVQRSVWYKFVAPTSADVSIEVKGNSWVPFTENYFLPDITIWELSDNTYASIDDTIAGCPTPSAANWNQLEFNDYQGIPNSLANGVYPTVVLTPQCLKPGYTYYVQVDGTAGIGLDGYFSIQIKNNQPSYSSPTNNEASGATSVPISTASCQYSNGTWQSAGGYTFGTNPTWSNPNLIGIANSSGIPSCTQNCGDVWFKFQMPAVCGNNTKSFVKIEGDDEFDLDLNGYPELAIAAYNGGSTTSTSNLSFMKCSVGGTGVDPDFSIAANPGDWIYLQVWDLEGNEQNKHFKLCVSQQKSADDCVDATVMTLDIPYCWSVESHTGETPNSAVPGSGLNTCFNDGNPKHSSYFKFTTDAATNFCDDYYIYINTAALAKQLPSGANHACLSGISSSVELNMALWELKSGGQLCTPGISNVTTADCQTWNDCGGGSFGFNVTGPHGNGGVVDDTIWYNMGSGQQLKPNTTYYIVLDYNIENPIYENRVVLDGVIEVGRRCKGRTWEYTTTSVITTNKYCTTRDGWRHYYDDKGTTSTNDDKYVFSLFPNGNTFEGTATITLDPTFHSYEDFADHFAEYVMKRRWDFNITSGSINPSNPVKVRFYYQNQEKYDVVNRAQWFAVNYPSNYEDFEWFKSANGHVFDPSTDVNSRVISVGPNGYSETGCLSYWNASGVYVGPPGVQRCNQRLITDWDDDNAYHEWCNGVHFCEYNGLTGFSGGTGGAGDSPWDISPLPVELTSFTGYNDGNKNVLNWTTASELNTSKFIVERAAANTGTFVSIGERPAAGNSSQPLNYTLDDNAPIQGENYYRLKIVDLDGSYKYSQTILINITNQVQYENEIVGVFPNPTHDMINVDYVASNKSTVTLRIYDALGQEMMKTKQDVLKGSQLVKLDVATFAKGVYIIQIQDENNGKIVQSKFIKD
ncbi:MAG: T9SS type A sorting domain-containing protein [Bacteroidetes bacterium]|nr:T9SS type A sorting domain-containing protein [Bacteroidota bacterium]